MFYHYLEKTFKKEFTFNQYKLNNIIPWRVLCPFLNFSSYPFFFFITYVLFLKLAAIQNLSHNDVAVSGQTPPTWIIDSNKKYLNLQKKCFNCIKKVMKVSISLERFRVITFSSFYIVFYTASPLIISWPSSLSKLSLSNK